MKPYLLLILFAIAIHPAIAGCYFDMHGYSSYRLYGGFYLYDQSADVYYKRPGDTVIAFANMTYFQGGCATTSYYYNDTLVPYRSDIWRITKPGRYTYREDVDFFPSSESVTLIIKDLVLDSMDAPQLMLTASIIPKKSSFNILSNPFSNSLKLIYNSNEYSTINAVLYDMNGNFAWSSSVNIQLGQNNLDLETSQVANGVYTLSISSSNPIDEPKRIRVVKF